MNLLVSLLALASLLATNIVVGIDVINKPEIHGTLAEAGREVPSLPVDIASTITDIENIYDSHAGYRHYFWDHMARGDYDIDFLRQYALHYYEHVRVFRLYLAGAMTVIPVEEMQVVLSEVIADEFGVRLWDEPDVDGHPELFRRFMRSLGLTEDDWEPVSTGKNCLDGVAHYKRVHYSLFQSGLAEETVGAIIFGMERTTPHRHSSVMEGLRKFTARTGIAVDAQFFEEHVAVDDYHNNALLYPIAEWFRDPVKVDRIVHGATTSFDARREMLDDLASAMGVSPPPAAECEGDFDQGLRWLPMSVLRPHEEFSQTRHERLVAYLESGFAESHENKTTIPAIIVSADGNVVLDGHHRLSALVALGFRDAPCLVVDYASPSIRVSGATKGEVMAFASAAADSQLMPMKTTTHTFNSESIEALSPLVTIALP